MISQPTQLLDFLELVPPLVESIGSERLFVVLDEPAYDASGARSMLEPFFQRKEVSRFVGFELNPKLSDVERGITVFEDFRPDMVIALGGGTAIDLAKLIAVLAVQPSSPIDLITGRSTIETLRPPLIAIPTTAGTGSEATHFAVVYVDGKKHSLAHSSLLPDFAVVDSRLTESLPKRITAATGLDAFCQAIESIWSVGATLESNEYAAEAVQLALEHLVNATQRPTTEARKAMSRASHLAGKAINLTKTTASHALSYPLTSNFGIPHGIAVAVTLAPMLAFNAAVTDGDSNDPRGADHVRRRIDKIVKLLNAENVDAASASIKKLLVHLDVPTSLAEAGVTTLDELTSIVDAIDVERLSNNPRRADRAALIELLTPFVLGE